MKYLLTGLVFCFLATRSIAQSDFPPQMDKSPMDMSYYPGNYPLLKLQGKDTEPLAARIIYGRPQKNGRVIFGELVRYNEVWRLGANEATEIEFFKDVKINNSKVKKGRYTLFCIPDTAKWTLIINKETDSWGSFIYNPRKDLLRVTVPVQKQINPIEDFSMAFEKAGSGANLIIGWDLCKVALPISF